MTYMELNWYYEKLVNTKKDEKKAQDESLKELEESRKLRGLSSKVRKSKRR